MCGLVASISSSRNIRSRDVIGMLLLGKHRGPDGHGACYVHNNHWTLETTENAEVALAHQRLSILDLSSGSDQPLLSTCGRFALVFNGEIYNYVELRTQLQLKGYQFLTTGDTEVLLAALIEWREDALNRLRGMFSFVFADLTERTVLAVRDRYGIKPLYMWHDRDKIHFASEIKQFSAHPNWHAKLHNKSALEFLLFGTTDYSEATCFQGVQHVKPGTFVKVYFRSGIQSSVVTWWNPKRESYLGSYNDACEEYRKHFEESIQIHLRSDVDIASCLSGGLDSSAIVGYASKILKSADFSHQTFTAVSENSLIDESRYALAVNQFSGTHGHHVLPTAERLWAVNEKMIWHQDEPFGTTSIFAQWCVFDEMSRSGVKVALDGQGADEPLAGYNSFVSLLVISLLMQGRPVEAFRSYDLFNRQNRVNLTSVLQTIMYSRAPKRVGAALGRIAGYASQNSQLWLNPTAIKQSDVRDPYLDNGKYPQSVSALRHDMVDRINLPMLLRFEDRNSMAFGIEARVPFVDHILMEFSLSLPDAFLFRDGATKTVLRDSLADCIPSLVSARRDKIGFQTNEKIWLGHNAQRILADIDRLRHRAPNLFTETTRSMVKKSLDSTKSNGQLAWRVHNFLKWMEIFDVSQ